MSQTANILKAAINIVTVVGGRIPLKRRGAQSWAGLCPFHQEKTGSFYVNQERQFYKCFGCGASGDVIKFVMEYEGVRFSDAVTLLAQRYGVPLPGRSDEAWRRYAQRIDAARQAALALVDRRDAYLLDLQTASMILLTEYHRSVAEAHERQDIELLASAEDVFAKGEELVERRDRFRAASGRELMRLFAEFDRGAA